MEGDTLSRSDALQQRTKKFALRVLRLFKALPKTEDAKIIGRRLVRCATSVGANYRAPCRARTPKEFAQRVRVVVEESDECLYWLELLTEGEFMIKRKLEPLMDESGQLLAIFCASLKTVQKRIHNGQMIRSSDGQIKK
jgi:four helix bundle protein